MKALALIIILVGSVLVVAPASAGIRPVRSLRSRSSGSVCAWAC
jgi:hypothetical protein